MRAREEHPESRFVIFSGQLDDEEAAGFLRAGKRGYSSVVTLQRVYMGSIF